MKVPLLGFVSRPLRSTTGSGPPRSSFDLCPTSPPTRRQRRAFEAPRRAIARAGGCTVSVGGRGHRRRPRETRRGAGGVRLSPCDAFGSSSRLSSGLVGAAFGKTPASGLGTGRADPRSRLHRCAGYRSAFCRTARFGLTAVVPIPGEKAEDWFANTGCRRSRRRPGTSQTCRPGISRSSPTAQQGGRAGAPSKSQSGELLFIGGVSRSLTAASAPLRHSSITLGAQLRAPSSSRRKQFRATADLVGPRRSRSD
jgi:hypothetical protein